MPEVQHRGLGLLVLVAPCRQEARTGGVGDRDLYASSGDVAQQRVNRDRRAAHRSAGSARVEHAVRSDWVVHVGCWSPGLAGFR